MKSRRTSFQEAGSSAAKTSPAAAAAAAAAEEDEEEEEEAPPPAAATPLLPSFDASAYAPAAAACSSTLVSLYRAATGARAFIKYALETPGWCMSWQRLASSSASRSGREMRVLAAAASAMRIEVKVTSTACAKL